MPVTSARDQITTLLLIRHGETDWDRQGRYDGRTDLRLNAAGRAQAIAVARGLASPRCDAIVSSPLARAWETAQVIARKTRVRAISTDDELIERDYGEVEGLTITDRLLRWPDGDWPGLEELIDVQDRALTALMEIASKYPGKRIAVITHNGVINAVLTYLSGGSAGIGKTTLYSGGITTLLHDADGLRIESVNQTTHMPGIPT